MTDQADTAREPPTEWINALDRAEADVAVGRVFDGAAVRQRLRDSIARMTTNAARRPAKGG